MKTIDIYTILDIEPVKAEGYYIWDAQGNEYLDFYGGHAVISIGHRHPRWVKAIKDQLDTIPFYTNAVLKSIENRVAEKMGELSGYHDYTLFFCNSGAEANENALKAASFSNGRSRIVAFEKAFHGRTSAVVAASGYKANVSALNAVHQVAMLPMNDLKAVEAELAKGDVAAVIIEGIQGVGGIVEPNIDFLQALRQLCTATGTFLILDEVQSGAGRTGKYFAHQHSGVQADMVTMAKGIGNGFPVAALIIGPQVKLKNGQLGTTFGGNHMACAAVEAVLDATKDELLMRNAADVGSYLKKKLAELPGIREVRGRGLMLAVEFQKDVAALRHNLLFEQKLFTGHSGNTTLRLLPALSITRAEADMAVERIRAAYEATV